MKRLIQVLLWLLPFGCLALFGMDVYFSMISPRKDGEYHVREFGSLPVLHNGRVQPFDSLARNSLLQIRSTGDVPLEEVPSWKFWHHAKKLRSTEWLLEVMARPDVADTRPIFLIHHADLLGELKLQDKGVAKSGLRYYTFNELEPVIPVIEEQGRKAEQVKAEQQTTFQQQVVKLFNAVSIYQRLKVTLQPPDVDDFAQELAEFWKHLPAARAALQAGDKAKDLDQATLQTVALPFEQLQHMAQYGYALVVPPLNPEAGRDHWQTAGASLLESPQQGEIHPALNYLIAAATAYHQEKPEAFNRAVAGYRAWLQPKFQKELRKGRAEFYFNNARPFLHAMITYVTALLLAAGALLTLGTLPNLSESLRRSAFYLIILAWLVHTFGLVFRMVLEGRPPVTNLYSSAIFIGWGAVVLGLILERIYRVGIGSFMAAVAGFITLLIAQNLALGGDTMEMLRAVLDTNFWLATHVVVVTLGYASTFAAGLLAILYIVLGVFTPLLRMPLGGDASPRRPLGDQRGRLGAAPLPAASSSISIGKALSKMVYGIVCFATLFSFVGTVLGGIWADQSWGRFWGWDPKENGALLIVLWNAVILHVRWGGIARDRGIMNLAVFGNIVTSFSWFGVNLLGIGLHSYGFTNEGFKWLMLFMASQLVVIGIGLLPLHLWRSFRQVEKTPPANSALPSGKPLPAGA
ncbi:MAG TPA: cytochrome c biogenesis protein CcsA [Candidatus Acidoferrum sp.]|nr:cytochrome c biogenesis protein CcsA [Candidatus Acidoferrum sp.]